MPHSMGNCISSKAGDSSHELQAYDPLVYQSAREIIRHPGRIVICVHFIAETVLYGGNHWTMYLETARKQSVGINMSPSILRGAPVPEHGFRGQINLVCLDYAKAKSPHAVVTIPAIPGHSVAHFIDTIVNAGNHEYDFTTEGRACTGWILDQYHLFTKKGLIQPGFDAIEEAIQLQWIRGRPTDTSRVTRGFYMKETRARGWSRM